MLSGLRKLQIALAEAASLGHHLAIQQLGLALPASTPQVQSQVCTLLRLSMDYVLEEYPHELKIQGVYSLLRGAAAFRTGTALTRSTAPLFSFESLTFSGSAAQNLCLLQTILDGKLSPFEQLSVWTVCAKKAFTSPEPSLLLAFCRTHMDPKAQDLALMALPSLHYFCGLINTDPNWTRIQCQDEFSHFCRMNPAAAHSVPLINTCIEHLYEHGLEFFYHENPKLLAETAKDDWVHALRLCNPNTKHVIDGAEHLFPQLGKLLPEPAPKTLLLLLENMALARDLDALVRCAPLLSGWANAPQHKKFLAHVESKCIQNWGYWPEELSSILLLLAKQGFLLGKVTHSTFVDERVQSFGESQELKRLLHPIKLKKQKRIQTL